MPANSIAKLAVVITGDAAPLNTSLNTASQSVKTFASHAEHAHSGGLNSLIFGIKASYQATHAFEGSMRGLVHTLHNIGGPAGATIVAGAAFAFLGYEALKAADNAATARNKIREDYEKAFEALNGTKSGIEMEDTISGSWKEAKEAVEDFMATLAENTGLVTGFINIFQNLSNGIKDLTESFKTAEQHARDKQMDALKKRTEELKELKKIQEEADKQEEKRQQQLQRELDETRKHAEHLTASLRLPDEIYRDTIIELKQLASQEFISGQTLARGMSRAREELERATDSAKKAKAEIDQRVGAVERYTSAGFSASQNYAKEPAKDAVVELKKLNEFQRKGVGDLDEIVTWVKGLKSLPLSKSNL